MAAESPPSASGLPFLGQTLDYARGHLHFVDKVTGECGDIAQVKLLGVGEYCLLAHPDHFEAVFLENRESFAKTDDYEVLSGQGVLATEGEQWQHQRTALNEFFYPQRIRSYADRMVELTERRTGRWTPGEVESVHRRMTDLTLDILFGTLFDRELQLGGDEELRRAAGDINLPLKDTTWALPRWVPTPARRRYREARDVLDSEARRLLADREREGTGDDLLSTLVELRSDGEADLTDQEIVDQVRTLIFAGHDTTANLLTCALHQLGTHPEVRERFTDELDSVLGDDPPTLADLPDLEVTERIVYETLRRYPSLNVLARRTTEDVEIGGYHVPAGTRTHLSIWSVHRHEAFWDDPEEWRPARWRDTSPREKGFAYVPFGAGPHSCIGDKFAQLEAKLVLATIGSDYWFEPHDGEICLENRGTAHPSDGVPARLHARNR